MTRNQRRAILILFAVVFLAGLVSAVIVAVQEAREASQRAECQNNLKQTGLSMVQYSTTKNAFPYAAIPNETLPVERRLNWLVSIIPYSASDDKYNGFDQTKSWDSPPNRPLGEDSIKVFHCPSLIGRSPDDQTQFVGITGVGPDSPWLPAGHPRAGVFGFDRVTHLSHSYRFRHAPHRLLHCDGLRPTLSFLRTSVLSWIGVSRREAPG
jgi:hypothetical protein